MAARPEEGGVPYYYPWATDEVIQLVVEDGQTLAINNKAQPLVEHTTYGLEYDEDPNYPEWNYQLQGNALWFEHLDKRQDVGDTRGTTSSETEAEISTRWGGTWVYIGDEVIGSDTIKYYRKTVA